MIFRPMEPTDHERRLRSSVRDFLRATLPPGYRPGLGFAAPHDPAFSRALGARGWVAMTMVPAPRIDLLGIHPTLQGLLAQLVVLVVLVAGFAWNARTARVAQVTP